MKFEIVLILTLVIASPCQSLLNTKYGNAILPVGGEDYLILPAIRSLAQAAFAKALLQGNTVVNHETLGWIMP